MDPKKKKSKLLAGIIIGSAIGSVIGVSMAPQSGKDTRANIADKGKKTWNILRTLIKGKKQ